MMRERERVRGGEREGERGRESKNRKKECRREVGEPSRIHHGVEKTTGWRAV
jgi:hypothetical protein